MSSSLFFKIVNNISTREAVYDQFCLDAKRMLLVIDGQDDHNIPAQCIYTRLINLFTNEKIGLWLAYWCTQTALASIYRTKLMDINHNFSVERDTSGAVETSDSFTYHLVDDGRQHVHICLSDMSNDHAEMYIYKPFRVCYYSERQSCMCTLLYYHLRIHITTHCLGRYDVQWTQYDKKVPIHVRNEHLTEDEDGETDDTWVILR